MDKQRAQRKLNYAVKKGILVRPEACSKCGATGVCSDGRSIIQGHHHDYSKPLEVEWICAKCHRKETPLPAVMGAPAFGECNGQAKLTREQVAEIHESPLGCRRLGRLYGVDKRTIQRIRQRKQWLAAAPAAPKEKV